MGANKPTQLNIQDGLAKSFLEIQLGAPADPCPGAPYVLGERTGSTHGPQHKECHQQKHPRHCRPAARACDAAPQVAKAAQGRASDRC